ncbi:MAG: SPOR domain-containing protein [Halanaerobiaceae bacterium]
MARQNTFSLTLIIIIVALLAVFVGYLLGNWILQMVTGDPVGPEQASEDEIVEEEIVEESEETQGEADLEEGEAEGETDTEGENTSTENIINEAEDVAEQELGGGVHVVQVGAFESYNNAVKLQEELESEGFDVMVTEDSPHRVQLGATDSREEAEDIKEELETQGYDAFITE